MIGIFQGSPKGRANECQRRAKGGHGRATSKKQGKRRAWEGALPKTGQFGSYGLHYTLPCVMCIGSPVNCAAIFTLEKAA